MRLIARLLSDFHLALYIQLVFIKKNKKINRKGPIDCISPGNSDDYQRLWYWALYGWLLFPLSMCCTFLFTYVLSSKRCELSLASRARGSCVCGAGSRMAGKRDPNPLNCLLLEQPWCTLAVPPQPARTALAIVLYTRDLKSCLFQGRLEKHPNFCRVWELWTSVCVGKQSRKHPSHSFLLKKGKEKKKGASAAMVTGWL